MLALADTQDAFAEALLDPERAVPTVLVAEGTGRSRGFDVYRNNRMSALVDALAATYPAVQRLVGETFFRGAARVYVQHEPPTSPILHRYGAGFGDFLDRFPPADAVPYLGDVARLEWSRLRSHHAPDAKPLPIQALASIPAQATPMVRLDLHPSLELHRSRWPVGSLRAALSGPRNDVEVDMTQSEDLAVLRPALEVQVRVLPDGGYAFVRALGEGATIERAARRGAAASEQFDLITQLQGLFTLGTVVAVHPPKEDES